MRKIYVIGGSKGYANWMQGEITNKMEKANLVVLTGGEDVSPSMYGEKKHPRTGNNKQRDVEEKQEAEKAINLGIPICGVCRGSQFISSILAGGKLVQHQYNPGNHKMKTYDGKELMVTSTHHQAQYPFNLPKTDYKILGWTKDISPYHEGGNEEEMNPPLECEVVYYPKIKALGIQPHPEYMPENHETVKYFQNLLNKLLDETL